AVDTRPAVRLEGAGKQLPGIAMVDALLAVNLAEALHQPAVDLRLDQDVVVDFSAVVDREITNDLERAGIGIDLDLSHVSAAWKSSRGIDLGDDVERMRSVAGILAGHLLESDRKVGPPHAVAAALKHKIVGGDLELFRRQCHAVADHLPGADRQRAAVADQRA